MTINQQWVLKNKEDHSAPSINAAKICPYFKKIYSLASYAAGGQCLADMGFTGRLCIANDIREYCNADYQQCPLFKVAAAGGVGESQPEDAWAWPSP